MPGQAKKMLREFYDQALLSPELLCLNCGNIDWSAGHGRCSDKKRHDCLLFVSDMVERLAQAGHPPAPLGKRPSAPLA
jgi:hypothetical protein